MNYLQVLFFPLLLLIYSFVMDKNAQNFQDIVAVIYGMLGVGGAVMSLIIYFLLKKYRKEDKWYINILIGVLGILVAFILVIIYSRLSSGLGETTNAVGMLLK